MRSASVLSSWCLLVGVLATACSSSSASTGADASSDAKRPEDAGAADHATGAGDARGDGGSAKDAAREADAFVVDAGTPPVPVGTAIEKGAITLVGVTDDGYVIYQHGNAVKAAPVAGGASTTLLDATDAAAANGIVVNVAHDVVFIWSNVDQTSGAATLTVWASSLAAAVTVSTSSVPSLFAASADSSVVVFSDGTSTDGVSTNLVAAQVTSLATQHLIASGIDPGNEDVPTCPPVLAMSGTGASLFAVVGACTPLVVDGGTNGPFIVTATPTSSWSPVVLAASASRFVVDGTGTSAAIVLSSGVIEIAPLVGGAPVLLGASLDAGAGDAGLDAGAPDASADLPGPLYLSPSDAFVLWGTRSGALFTSPLTAASATILATAGAIDLDAVDPTGAFVLVDQGADALTGFPEGLALASTTAPGPVTSLDAADVFLNMGGDAFTADGHYALYIAEVAPDVNGNPVGALVAASVAGPTAPRTVASGSGVLIDEITGAPSRTFIALTAGRVAFVDAFDSSLGQTGQADLKVLDLALTAPAELVMAAADPSFAVSHDAQRILYTITYGGTTDGLYTVAVP